MTSFKEYEQRAAKWALSSSTIIGIATIAAAAVGSGVDATTGLPWVAAGIGLAVGGLVAIFLPQQNAAPIIAGAQAILAAAENHAANTTKAADAAVAAAAAVEAVAPKISAQVQQVSAQVATLAPIAEMAAAAAGQSGVAKAIDYGAGVARALGEAGSKPLA